MPIGPGPDMGKQFVLAVNQLGHAVEHLARSVDNTILFFRDIAQQGRDPAGFVKDVASVFGKIMDGISSKKR